MKYPEFVKSDSRIGFIAPSFGCDSEPYRTFFEKAVKRFSDKGFTCIEGENVRKSCGIGKSNTAQKCGEEINSFFCQQQFDVIISAGGGETMCEDLNYVDFNAISTAKPRWFLGYSDNTNLTFTLPVICDIAAVYGPCASKFGELPFTADVNTFEDNDTCFSTAPSDYVQNTWNLLTGKQLTVQNYTTWELESLKTDENPFAPLNAVMPFGLSACLSGVFHPTDANNGLSADFSGRLIGGCLDCLVNLAGTPFDRTQDFVQKYKSDGIVWFLEACDLNVMGIRRALWQLDNAGWFKNASGFLFGRPLHYDEGFAGADRFNSVTDILGKYNVPIIFDLDIGHLPPQMPIISGAIGQISIKGNCFTLKHILA